MDKEDELEGIIGKDNLKVLRNAIKEGKVETASIRSIAKRMKGSVLGTYKEKSKTENAVNVFNYMLDTWYEEAICKKPEEDWVQRLVDILDDDEVGEHSLARKLKPVKPGVLNIGLPDTHYKIQGLQEHDKTGAMAYPSNQGQTLTCASHAVGKAILEILDSVGWDADQQTIIDALVEKFQRNGQPENPDIFNNEIVKVKVTNKEVLERSGVIDLEIKIQTHFGKVLDSHAFKTIPINVDLKKHHIRMVLRWDMYDTNQKKYTPHAIYAKEYRFDTEKYSCINSWGDQQEHPQISKSDVEAIYYVSVRQVL